MKRFYLTIGILTLLFSMGASIFMPLPHSVAQSGQIWTALFYNPPTGSTDCGAHGLSNGSVTVFTGLNKNWGTGAPTDSSGQPILGIGTDCFSATFTARDVDFAGGLYEFSVNADDGIRLTLTDQATFDSTVILDDYVASGLRQRSSLATVQGGTYTIIVEYVEYSADAVLQVDWFVSDGTPRATSTSPPAHIANVVQVRGLAVRSGPFLGGSLRGVARPDAEYPVIARNTQEGLFTWYKIQYDIDTIGWSSGRYLTFTTGDPETLPLETITRFDTVYDPPGNVIGVTRSVMNFRIYPTQRAGRILAVPQLFWGAEVQILARTVQGGRDFWYQVRYTPDGSATSYVGWIFAPYVGIKSGSAPIDSIPVI